MPKQIMYGGYLKCTPRHSYSSYALSPFGLPLLLSSIFSPTFPLIVTRILVFCPQSSYSIHPIPIHCGSSYISTLGPPHGEISFVRIPMQAPAETECPRAQPPVGEIDKDFGNAAINDFEEIETEEVAGT